MDYNLLCKKACESIFNTGKQELIKLYDCPKDIIEHEEREALIKASINLPIIAQETIKNLLVRNGVQNDNLIWRDISSKLPRIEYTYINWNQRSDPSYHPILENRKVYNQGFKQKINNISIHLSRERNTSYNNANKIIAETKEKNINELRNWCRELEGLMISVLNIYLS